ncbi:hypothetical protein Cni_G17074 [Canna indica]|uniref:Uncharacterized protein n=1 Tax=Canna indica TaxID=4628 RepID=A0AAQ3KM24_9LILI|nr:hypothetical protein Cni_G17074 [Canna indica]
MGIKKGDYPIKYLGACVDKGRIPIRLQRKVIEKVEDIMKCKASRNISQAGKVVLINSIINSIPVHSLSTTWFNKKVIKEHAKKVRSFLWRSSERKHGFHLVSWKNIAKSKLNGGLGIRDLSVVKHAIHARRVLDFPNRKERIWVKLLSKRYEEFHLWFYKFKTNIS